MENKTISGLEPSLETINNEYRGHQTCKSLQLPARPRKKRVEKRSTAFGRDTGKVNPARGRHGSAPRRRRGVMP